MKLNQILRFLLAFLMTSAGIMHFVHPEQFVRIVPDYLPGPLLLVYISGFFEILGGIGLLIPKISRQAAWGLIALYVAVFPANVNMAINQIPLGDMPAPTLLLWLRLPLQALLIYWAWTYTKNKNT